MWKESFDYRQGLERGLARKSAPPMHDEAFGDPLVLQLLFPGLIAIPGVPNQDPSLLVQSADRFDSLTGGDVRQIRSGISSQVTRRSVSGLSMEGNCVALIASCQLDAGTRDRDDRTDPPDAGTRGALS